MRTYLFVVLFLVFGIVLGTIGLFVVPLLAALILPIVISSAFVVFIFRTGFGLFEESVFVRLFNFVDARTKPSVFDSKSPTGWLETYRGRLVFGSIFREDSFTVDAKLQLPFSLAETFYSS